jgi:hypothetical protein
MTTDLEARIATSLHLAADTDDVPDSNLAAVVRRARLRRSHRRFAAAFALVVLLAGAATFVIADRSTHSPRVTTPATEPATFPTTVAPVSCPDMHALALHIANLQSQIQSLQTNLAAQDVPDRTRIQAQLQGAQDQLDRELPQYNKLVQRHVCG